MAGSLEGKKGRQHRAQSKALPGQQACWLEEGAPPCDGSARQGLCSLGLQRSLSHIKTQSFKMPGS